MRQSRGRSHVDRRAEAGPFSATAPQSGHRLIAGNGSHEVNDGKTEGFAEDDVRGDASDCRRLGRVGFCTVRVVDGDQRDNGGAQV